MKSLIGLILFTFSFSSVLAQGIDQQTGSVQNTSPLSALNSIETIHHKKIYTYSFLDLRETEYTRKVLDTINVGLAERLKVVGVSGPLLEYRNTPQGEFLADNMGLCSSSTAVPVREVIEGNAQVEEAAGTKL